jgi:hypothetical protein
MVNYTNSKVYKIWSTQGDKIYVGSTTKQYLSQRMEKHRSDYKCWKDENSKRTSSFKLFEEYGLENCFIELIEAKECNSKDELHRLEGKYIRELNCINKNIAGRTKQEYYDDNREQLIEKCRLFKINNKELISDSNKQYYDLNKETINQRKNEKNDCECGGKYIRAAKSQHFKTLKHCQYIESQIIKPEDGAE